MTTRLRLFALVFLLGACVPSRIEPAPTVVIVPPEQGRVWLMVPVPTSDTWELYRASKREIPR